MREIKFRAWDKEHKLMRYQDKEFYHIALRRGLNGNEFWREYGNHIDNFFTPEQGELMQYTGLKDKNGKEIYEGDIVRHYDYPYCKAGGTSEVKWDSDTCGFRPFTEKIADYGHPSSGEWIEIIGNIYENPDLLEVNQ